MSLVSFLKKLIIFIIIGTVIGAILGYALALLDEDLVDVFERWLIIIAVVGYIIFCFYIISKYGKFMKEVNRLVKILYEDLNTEKYIAETKTAVSNTKNKIYKLQLSMNLAIGYNAMGDYRRAIECMEELHVKNANVKLKALYYNNLACFYYDAGNVQEAIRTHSEGERYINRFLKNPFMASTFMHTKAMIEYSKGDLQASEELLERSKRQDKLSNHGAAAVNLYLAKIYMKTDRTQKAKVLLEYNMIQKLLPNIMEETRKLLAETNERSS